MILTPKKVFAYFHTCFWAKKCAHQKRSSRVNSSHVLPRHGPFTCYATNIITRCYWQVMMILSKDYSDVQ